MRRRKNQSLSINKQSKDIVELWILKILLDLNGHREFMSSMRGFTDDELAYFLGLDKFVDEYEEKDKKEIFKILQNRLEVLESGKKLKFPKTLKKNIKKVMKLISITKVEKDILIFTIYLKYIDMMDGATRMLNDLSTDRMVTILSVLLDHKSSKIKTALAPQGKLAQSGLVTVDREGAYSFLRKLDILSSDFADKMMNLDGDIEEMIKDSVRKCTTAELTVADFKHLKTDMELLIPYLDNTIVEQKSGVNILFYGKPGTGKTELTKAIAQELDKEIYEVSYADENDEPISGDKRLKAYKVAQSFFSNSNVLIMFDEIEDVVGNDNSFSFFAPPKQSNKGWMNRILETNNIPAIWITNDIHSMDPAIIRRFDMSIEIPIPPKEKRKEIIEKDCAEMLSEKSIEKIAKNEAIAPALVTRAAKVVNSIEDSSTEKDKAFENILNNTLKAQGYPKIQNTTEEALPESYDPSYINTDTDLKALAQGIKAHPNARICLYGVPGTGKSAFGKWIAQYTNKPFVLKKGSDLISMWVGGTEQNIANAFREAKEEGAVLVFDEVDSFLQDRRGAKNSWEVTQVNEMLVQMENFDGIFIATTNLMSGLDQASLRRFDMKLEFGYLKPKQAWKLFVDECKVLKIDISDKEQTKKKVQSLTKLAPGDFAAVRRQSRFRPLKSAEIFLERLEEEVLVKENDSSNKMGFI
ncbi:MAG: AAA family ATPase [Sulfurovum sp.]|nr:AAA family ATPase [Sulfurovum sp.]